jgi:hypothetical protein
MGDHLKAVTKNKGSFHFVLLSLLFILLSVVFTACDFIQTDQGALDEPVSQAADEQNDNNTNKDLTETEREINAFLLQGEVLSTSDVVGSGYPELYFFSEQGTYAYLGSQYGVRADGQLLSQRGQWLVRENILMLNVLEEQRAYGGEPTDDLLLGEILTGYQVVLSDQSYQLAYAVSFGQDEIGRPYLLWNNQPLYLLAIPEDDIVPLSVLAEEGYPAFERLSK